MAADKPIKVGRWREAKGASEALNHLQCGLCARTEVDARRGSAAVRDVDEQSSSTDGLREQRKGHVHRVEGLREEAGKVMFGGLSEVGSDWAQVGERPQENERFESVKCIV